MRTSNEEINESEGPQAYLPTQTASEQGKKTTQGECQGPKREGKNKTTKDCDQDPLPWDNEEGLRSPGIT